MLLPVMVHSLLEGSRKCENNYELSQWCDTGACFSKLDYEEGCVSGFLLNLDLRLCLVYSQVFLFSGNDRI